MCVQSKLDEKMDEFIERNLQLVARGEDPDAKVLRNTGGATASDVAGTGV